MTFNEFVSSAVVHDTRRRSLMLAIEESRIRRSGKTPIRLIPVRVAMKFSDELKIGDVFQANGGDIVYQVVE